MNDKTDGFLELENQLKDIISKDEHIDDVLENLSKDFVNDLLKLTNPMSKIKKSEYTHMVDSFTYNKRNDEYEVGWGKYYGKWVEKGVHYNKGKHSIMLKAQPHLQPTFEKNFKK